MDGVTLLQRVKNKYLETTRIALSTQADQHGVARALPVTHQFLSKPCDNDVLRTVLQRTCGLRALLVNDRIRKSSAEWTGFPRTPPSTGNSSA